MCTKLSASNILRYVSTPNDTIWVLKGLGSRMYLATLSPAITGLMLSQEEERQHKVDRQQQFEAGRIKI